MFKRLAAAAILALLPIGTLADDATPTPDPATATDTPAPAAAPTDGLGPSTASSGSSDPGTGAVLQPAGTAPVQSAATDSNGMTAPSGALQAPAATSDQLKVLSGEADGAPHNADDSTVTAWGWLLMSLSIAILVGIGFIIRDRRRFARTHI